MNQATMAFIGDAFFELAVRKRLAESGGTYAADKLHFAAVRYVNAVSQARAMRGLTGQGALTDDELDLVRRARNRKTKSIPKNTDPLDYKLATAFESLLGFHYMAGNADRADELTELAIRIIDGENS